MRAVVFPSSLVYMMNVINWEESALTLEDAHQKTLLRHLPNAISVARLACTPILAWMAASGMERSFAWLLLAALASDAVDGLLARKFAWTSRIGSLFDSLADAILMLIAAYGIWVFHPYVFDQYGAAIWTVIGLWAFQHLLAFIRYGRPASFHTRLVRIAVMTFSLFIVTLFLISFQAWLFLLAVVMSLIGVCEELIMILLVPEWTPNLRGGLIQVLRRRAAQRGRST